MKMLFVTTKNLDYIRNAQEIVLLSKGAGQENVTVIGSYSRHYLVRLFYVYKKLSLLKLKEYDEVFIGFAPQLVIPFLYGKFRRYHKSGGRLTIDFFISVYDTLVSDRKRFREGTVPAKLTARLDRRTLSLADKIIVDTKAHGQYFSYAFGAPQDKIEVLYLKADERIYYPREVGKPPEFKDKYVVSYFGTGLPLQGVDVINDAIRLLAAEENLHFIMIGDMKKTLSQKNVTYCGWLSQEELAGILAFSDLCLAGHFNGSIEKASRTIPGKAYIYQAMHKPMILGDNPANREIFDESMQGIRFCKMGDAKSLADAIREAYVGEAV